MSAGRRDGAADPRASNTGVTFGAGGVRFDWYAATLEEFRGGDFVATVLAAAAGGSLSRVRGRYGYALALAVERDGHELALVLYGAAAGADVHVEIPGAGCDALVAVLRERWPVHGVSRVDVAMDFEGDFEELDAAVLGAVGHRVSHQLITGSDGGATRYLGAPSSDCRVRVYRKTEQLRALYGPSVDVPEGILRVEAQIRPGVRAKGRFASLTPAEAMSYRALSRDVAAVALPGAVTRWQGETVHKRPTSWERVLEAVSRQYGPSVARRAEVVGAEAAGQELLAALALGSTGIGSSAIFAATV